MLEMKEVKTIRKIKSIICYIKAIPFWLRYGEWIPHVFKEDSREDDVIIVSTNNSFRVAKDFSHRPNERIHPKATLITCKCKYCGIKEYEWFDVDPIRI